MSRPYGLSKSRYIAGLQCYKQLWWRVHEPQAPELVPDTDLQNVFDTGSHVGEVARGYVPGGVLIDLPHTDYKGKVAATQRAIESGAPAIYEASFIAGQVFVAVVSLPETPSAPEGTPGGVTRGTGTRSQELQPGRAGRVRDNSHPMWTHHDGPRR